MSSFVERLHASPIKCVLHTTGAGASAIQGLMSVPGCSRTLLKATVPYALPAAFSVLDHHPTRMLCSDASRDLAYHAFLEAKRMVPHTEIPNIIGLGASAAVQTDRTRHGEDAVFVSVWSATRPPADYSLVMSKERTRLEQEDLVKQLIFKALGEAAGISCQLENLRPEEVVQIHSFDDFDMSLLEVHCLPWVLKGEVNSVLLNSFGAVRVPRLPFTSEAHDPQHGISVLFPGSFNPLHWGHTEWAKAAERIAIQRYQAKHPNTDITTQVTYEISVSRVGKGIIDVDEAMRRVNQFTRSGLRIALTTAKLFIDKAKVFPNHGFVVGFDTMKRIIDPMYYEDSEEKMIAALREIGALGGYFLVGGRKEDDGRWATLTDLAIPHDLQDMVIEIPEKEFRVDVSSTELRTLGKTVQ